MFLSLPARAPLPLSKALWVDTAVAGWPAAWRPQRESAGQFPWRHALGQRRPVHALLADSSGAWSWGPDDAHAAATRHASLPAWFKANPGCDMRLWLSAELTRSLDHHHASAHRDDETLRSSAHREFIERHSPAAAAWALTTRTSDAGRGVRALAGTDLNVVNREAGWHDVRVRSVVPWWYHASLVARRCVNALNQADRGHVCVVEGREIAWITTVRGLLADVRQGSLEAATVGALQAVIAAAAAQSPGPAPVVLGQGLVDGARTSGLSALVLGRLDGDQPPLWLRPSGRTALH